MQEKLWSTSVIGKEEEIMGLVEEVCVGGTWQKLEDILDMDEKSTWVVPVESVKMYGVIARMDLDMLCENNTMVNTNYKAVEKKVKPTTGPLPAVMAKAHRPRWKWNTR